MDSPRYEFRKCVGAGNFPIDVYSPNEYGADVKFVSAKVDKAGEFKGSLSNETSLAQNFTKEGDDLDTVFKVKKYDEILIRREKLLEEKFKRQRNFKIKRKKILL